MANEINDQPAFPSSLEGLRMEDGRCTDVRAGMSLGDYFAASAMRAFLASNCGDPETLATDSYIIARAMLAERQKWMEV